MTSYAMDFLARERMQERQREADRDRLVRAVATRPTDGRSWHTRLSLAVVGRWFRLAEAS